MFVCLSAGLFDFAVVVVVVVAVVDLSYFHVRNSCYFLISFKSTGGQKS